MNIANQSRCGAGCQPADRLAIGPGEPCSPVRVHRPLSLFARTSSSPPDRNSAPPPPPGRTPQPPETPAHLPYATHPDTARTASSAPRAKSGRYPADARPPTGSLPDRRPVRRSSGSGPGESPRHSEMYPGRIVGTVTVAVTTSSPPRIHRASPSGTKGSNELAPS